VENFEKLTIELLKHKYAYYILCSPIISDYEFDMLERDWMNLGRKLGVDMDNYPHWVDFDEEHPLAGKAKEAYNCRR
jgi:NAD-dependent DNA ligase